MLLKKKFYGVSTPFNRYIYIGILIPTHLTTSMRVNALKSQLTDTYYV